MAAMDQDVLRAELARASRHLKTRAGAIAGNLAPGEMQWRPPAGGWSVAEVFEHLVVANGTYLGRLRDLAHAATPTARPGARWRPSLAGGLLVRAFASRRRFPAPRVFRPGPAPREEVIAAFIATLDELGRLMDTAAGLDWRRVRTSSPVSRAVRLNLGDCFVVVVRHAERHFRQIDRVRAAWRRAAASDARTEA